MVDHHRFFVMFHLVKGLPFPTFSLFGLTELDLQLERMTSVVLFPKLHENTLASNPAPCENTTSLPRSPKDPWGAARRTTGSQNWVKRRVKPIDFCIIFPFLASNMRLAEVSLNELDAFIGIPTFSIGPQYGLYGESTQA